MHLAALVSLASSSNRLMALCHRLVGAPGSRCHELQTLGCGNQRLGPLPAPEPAAALRLGVQPTSGASEPKHLLSEVLPDVLSWQAFGSLVPLPSRVPRRRSPELDQGPRVYPELRGPLEGGRPLASVPEAGPELGASDSSAEGSSGGSGPQPACPAGPARRSSLGLSVLHVTCVDLSLLSATPAPTSGRTFPG